ncbi:MAG: hypothetical protein M0Q46_04000 [Endomicrobiales bacterium]|nr:hypothetical protein [Endomicrobiales bacterium]
MKKLSFVLTVVLLFCVVVVLEAKKTPAENNFGIVGACEGVKSDDAQSMDKSKCPVVVSTENTVVESMEGGKVVSGPDGKKYIDHTVGVGTALATSGVEVKKSSCCSCECCKNCKKCTSKDYKMRSVNQTIKCECCDKGNCSTGCSCGCNGKCSAKDK